MLVTECPQTLHEILGSNVETAFTLHGFENDRGDISGCSIVLKYALDAVHGIVSTDSVQCVWILRAVDVARHEPHTSRVRCNLSC
ncbi:hypothetical protein D3C75_731700 [compost metagenome]